MDILIDFDGTCTTHSFPEIGEDIGAVPVLKKLVNNGHRLILFTMRSDVTNPTSVEEDFKPLPGNYLTDAVNWFEENDIPLYGIQKHPTQHHWTSSPKAYGNYLIDDINCGIPLIKPQGLRPYVDWIKVEQILIEEGILQ